MDALFGIHADAFAGWEYGRLWPPGTKIRWTYDAENTYELNGRDIGSFVLTSNRRKPVQWQVGDGLITGLASHIVMILRDADEAKLFRGQVWQDLIEPHISFVYSDGEDLPNQLVAPYEYLRGACASVHMSHMDGSGLCEILRNSSATCVVVMGRTVHKVTHAIVGSSLHVNALHRVLLYIEDVVRQLSAQKLPVPADTEALQRYGQIIMGPFLNVRRSKSSAVESANSQWRASDASKSVMLRYFSDRFGSTWTSAWIANNTLVVEALSGENLRAKPLVLPKKRASIVEYIMMWENITRDNPDIIGYVDDPVVIALLNVDLTTVARGQPVGHMFVVKGTPLFVDDEDPEEDVVSPSGRMYKNKYVWLSRLLMAAGVLD